MLYFWWGCRRNLKLITFGIEWVKCIQINSNIEKFISFTISLPRVINFKFPVQPHQTYYIVHSMKNLAFHSLLRWKMNETWVHGIDSPYSGFSRGLNAAPCRFSQRPVVFSALCHGIDSPYWQLLFGTLYRSGWVRVGTFWSTQQHPQTTDLLFGGGVFVIDQITGSELEVVEHVLFVGERSALVPRLAVLTATNKTMSESLGELFSSPQVTNALLQPLCCSRVKSEAANVGYTRKSQIREGCVESPSIFFYPDLFSAGSGP